MTLALIQPPSLLTIVCYILLLIMLVAATVIMIRAGDDPEDNLMAGKTIIAVCSIPIGYFINSWVDITSFYTQPHGWFGLTCICLFVAIGGYFMCQMYFLMLESDDRGPEIIAVVVLVLLIYHIVQYTLVLLDSMFGFYVIALMTGAGMSLGMRLLKLHEE